MRVVATTIVKVNFFIVNIVFSLFYKSAVKNYREF
ncbi:hypothetical protein CF65_02078 [Aggregatibacter actinomycetemcomitans HK1651]|nr:hypothetical protein CF65_02078 [Aggregatibacter actinomycetemcomitans HK1651]